jgi:predicted GNAT superfamily acetyltransferase
MSHFIRPLGQSNAAEAEALRALNNLHAEETSFLDAANWLALVEQAFRATSVAPTAAFLIALDETADYGSPNFLWFKARYPRFVYVDRIIVSAAHRGRGLARALYEDLFAETAARGHEHVLCEVNRVPPNPVSDAFHAALGFHEVGEARLDGRDKTVRYLRKNLAA